MIKSPNAIFRKCSLIFFVCCLFLFWGGASTQHLWHRYHNSVFRRSVSLFFLFFFLQIVGGLQTNQWLDRSPQTKNCFFSTTYRGLLHKVLNVFLSVLLVLVLFLTTHFLLLHDTLGHLFVVAAGRQSILGRRNGLAEILVLEFSALKRRKIPNDEYRFQLQQNKGTSFDHLDQNFFCQLQSQAHFLTSSIAVKYCAPYSKMFSGWSRSTSLTKS